MPATPAATTTTTSVNTTTGLSSGSLRVACTTGSTSAAETRCTGCAGTTGRGVGVGGTDVTDGRVVGTVVGATTANGTGLVLRGGGGGTGVCCGTTWVGGGGGGGGGAECTCVGVVTGSPGGPGCTVPGWQPAGERGGHPLGGRTGGVGIGIGVCGGGPGVGPQPAGDRGGQCVGSTSRRTETVCSEYPMWTLSSPGGSRPIPADPAPRKEISSAAGQ